MTNAGEWFIRTDNGQLRMAGWMGTAIKTEPTGQRDTGWLRLSICPRCHALVLADEHHAYGDQTSAHEQWHAKTDHPVPSALADARRARAAG